MPKIVPPPDPTAKEEPGAQIARWLGPVGGGFVLLLSVLMVVFCLTRGANPVPGYTPPHDSTYYAQHLDELAQELNANVLPVLDETAHAEVRDGTVTVTAREDALACTITVSDTGPGIAPEDLPRIFERFYRGRAEVPATSAGERRGEGADAEDVRQPAGFGIGLSLAQALVSAQGGTLRAANNPEDGARFEMAFPKLVV